MKTIITFLGISLLALSVNAQNNLATANAAKPAAITTPVVTEEVLLIKETEFDFGKIPQGKPVIHIFEITNKGKDSLNIVNVQASCGCTTPVWEREKSHAPGDKTNITVGYNAASEGPFNKSITITYNGTQTKQLIIKGEVWKTPVSSAPENKELGSLKD